MTSSGRATRFLERLQYPRSIFDGRALIGTCWTTLSHAREADGSGPGGIAAARRRDSGDVSQQEAGGFQRYRVADSNTLQWISSAVICPAQKVYQTRDQALFPLSTMKSFVGRDQLRENIFIKYRWEFPITRVLWKSCVHPPSLASDESEEYSEAWSSRSSGGTMIHRA